MPVKATGAFGAVVQGALQVAQAVRDQFAQRTNADAASRLALNAAAGGTGSSTPEGLPWQAFAVLDYFDLTQVDPNAKGFEGMAFNGRDLFYVPYGLPSSNPGALLVSYNTTLPFASTSSYQTVSLTAVTGSTLANSFIGGVVDAQGYLYLVPDKGSGGNGSGLVVRFDTTRILSDTVAYSTFNLTTLNASASGYAFGCCDGRWVYLCPALGGIAARYDTTKTFGASMSWETINLPATVNSDLNQFQTIITDGQYVYYAPFTNKTMAQYNTSLPFTSPSSWQSFDTVDLIGAGGFTGACRVGRYLYFIPWHNGPVSDADLVPPASGFASVIARFDTVDPRGLTSAAAWATFDLTKFNTGALGYQGAIGDGVYLYLIPTTNGLSAPPFLRYDTRLELTDLAAWQAMSGSTAPSNTNILSTGGASDGVYGYSCPYNTIPGVNPLVGTVYRWRLWPGQPDTPSRVGMSRAFWLDSSQKAGFGTQTPVEQVQAGTFVSYTGATVTTNVRADGLLLGQMGASGIVAPAPVSATVSTAASSSQGPTPTTLVSYTLPASALSAPNKGVRVTAFGAYATNADTDKDVSVFFGGVKIVDTASVTLNGGSWYLRATVFDKGAGAQVGGGMIVSASTPAGLAKPTSGRAAISASEAAAITIAVQGTGTTAGDVTLAGFVVEFVNASNP